jgi:hypothetical protein
MPIPTLKVIASLLQMHGPGATIHSDHQGIDALLNDIRGQISDEGVVPAIPDLTEAAFRRGGFIRGGGGAGGFRRAGSVGPGGGFRRGVRGPGGGFRRGGFVRV